MNLREQIEDYTSALELSHVHRTRADRLRTEIRQLLGLKVRACWQKHFPDLELKFYVQISGDPCIHITGVARYGVLFHLSDNFSWVNASKVEVPKDDEPFTLEDLLQFVENFKREMPLVAVAFEPL